MAGIPSGSIEYVVVPVSVRSGAMPASPSVFMAFVPRGQRPTSWAPAEWVDSTIRYLLPGPLAAGEYVVWVRIIASPEDILRRAGTITLT